MVWVHDKEIFKNPMTDAKKEKLLKDIDTFKEQIVELQKKLPSAKSNAARSFILEDQLALAKKINNIQERLGRV